MLDASWCNAEKFIVCTYCENQPICYQLQSVVVHSELQYDSGHYLTYVKTTGGWLCMNDSHVTEVNEQCVFTSEAYLLSHVQPNPEKPAVVSEEVCAPILTQNAKKTRLSPIPHQPAQKLRREEQPEPNLAGRNRPASMGQSRPASMGQNRPASTGRSRPASTGCQGTSRKRKGTGSTDGTTAPKRQLESEGDSTIQVVIRVRPPATDNRDDDAINITSSSLTFMHTSSHHTFHFDKVFCQKTSQEAVFQSLVDILDHCLAGKNGTIFAYGQTGSGKTFTMFGPSQKGLKGDLRGVIPCSFEYLFDQIKSQQDIPGRNMAIKVSSLEIYNEKLFDLVTGNKLERADGLQVPVTCERELFDIFKTTSAKRRAGATALNNGSSRSHLVFIVFIESKEVRMCVSLCVYTSAVHCLLRRHASTAASFKVWKNTFVSHTAHDNQER